MNTQQRLDEALRNLLAAQATVEALATKLQRFPVEPPEGTVLRYAKTYDARPNYRETRTYVHVATRCGDKWYITARTGVGITWDALLLHIDAAHVEFATTWVPEDEWRATINDVSTITVSNASATSDTNHTNDESTS